MFGFGKKDKSEEGKINVAPVLQEENAGEEITPLRKPKIGLALGAGVARGWAHIGVIRGLEAKGIKPDVIAGTSIGAVVGGAMATDSLDELEAWARSLKSNSFFRWLDFKFGGSGLFGSNKLNDLMDERFGNNNIEDLKIPFTAVACELKTGHEIWLKEGDLSDCIQASFALPGVFEPKRLKRKWLVDGALVNPVPVSVCRAQACDLIIAVNLSEDLYGRTRARRRGTADTGEYGVFAETGIMPKSIKATGSSGFFNKLFSHKGDAPSLFANMVASLNILQNRLSRSRLAGDPPDVTITPRCGHIGLMEFHRSEELIDEGAHAFEEAWPHIQDAYDAITHQINS